MGGKAELVKRRHRLDPKAALDENARVAGEGRRIAGDGDDERQSAGGERARLLERARARRIEQRGVERGELVGSQRTAEKVARLGGELAQARRRRGARSSAAIAAGSESAAKTSRRAGEPQREGAGAAEEVRDLFRVRERALGEFREPRLRPLRSPAGSRRAASATSASPKATRGGRRSITTSP